LMRRRKRKTSNQERLTISLGEGQRAELETIARTNHTSLAFVIRYALDHFIAQHKDKQLRLHLPS
jgi:hypothetical protein